MRFSYHIPALVGREEADGEIKGDSEMHCRAVLRAWLGHEAAVAAILKPITVNLDYVLQRKQQGASR